MTRDEIQKLIGGYATSSLTESERKLLFDAALEDQELFDQLAREQALKELLEVPGAKQRLITALQSDKKPAAAFWKKQWAWALAGTAALAVLIGVAVLRTPEKPQELAAVTKSVDQVAPPVAAPPAPEPTPTGRQGGPTQLRKSTVAKPLVAEDSPAMPPKAPPPPEPPKAEKATAAADAIQETAALPVPPPLPPAPINGFVAGPTPQITIAQNQVAPATAGAPAPQAQAGGRGGGGGGRGGGGRDAAAARAALVTPTRFAFDYSFDAAGALRIIPTAAGYLSVSVPTQPTSTVLFPSRNVPPATPIIVQIPADASELIVAFSAAPGVTGSPTRRDEPSGTAEDSTPNHRILITIPARR